MASYFCQISNLSRLGKYKYNAVKAAAYRSRSKIRDQKLDVNYDYSGVRKDLIFETILAPISAPSWIFDRSRLWNEVEKREIRKDARLAKEIVVALPHELDRTQNIKLVLEFVQNVFVSKGMIADICFHKKKNNPHAHIMLTTRKISKQGFGLKNREWNKKELVNKSREKWAEIQNKFLTIAGDSEKVSHLSFLGRGILQIPKKRINKNLLKSTPFF